MPLRDPIECRWVEILVMINVPEGRRITGCCSALRKRRFQPSTPADLELADLRSHGQLPSLSRTGSDPLAILDRSVQASLTI